MLYGLPIVLSAAIKLFVWSPQVTPFNSDEAIVALMARHINQGQLMTFFYGQYYMGSLDAMFVSLFFRVFGEHVWVIRLVQSLLYLGTVATTVTLAARILVSRKGALIAGLITAVPPVFGVLYTTVSLGGYGEMLLMGNLLLLGGLSLVKDVQERELLTSNRFYFGLFAWGLGAGCAFWVIGLSLVYIIPVLSLLTWEYSKANLKNGLAYIYGGAAVLLGILAGSSPWWFSALIGQNHSIISELLGGAIAGANAGFWMLKPLVRFGSLVAFGISVVTGMRPPWGVSWLMLPLLPFVLIFWLAAFVNGVNQVSSIKDRGRIALLLVGVVLIAGFIFSPYGDDPSGRYFLPLIVPMAILAADLIVSQFEGRSLVEAGLVLMILIFNLGGIFQSRLKNPPGLTTQFDRVAQVDHTFLEDLLKFLEDHEIRTGYSNYWVSYPVAFLSSEQIIFSPRLPYHEDFRYTDRDDRYRPYTDLVESSAEIAYITTRNPALDSYLRQQFSDFEISWKEKRIGDYTVYYDLSQPVHVAELGLGVTTNP